MRRSTRHRLKQRALYLGVVALCALLAVWLATWGEAADTRRYMAPAPSGPTCTGTVQNETYNTNPGYDNAWTESVCPGCTADPDNTTRTEAPYFSGESLRLFYTGNFQVVQSLTLPGTNTTHIAVSFMLTDASALAVGQQVGIVAFFRQFTSNYYLCALIENNAGTLRFRLDRATAGQTNCQNGSGTTIDTWTPANGVLNTVIVLELEYTDAGANDVLQWWGYDCGATGNQCTTTPDHTFNTTADVLADPANSMITALNFPLSAGGNTLEGYFGFAHMSTAKICN